MFFSFAYILKDGRKLQDKLEAAHSNEKAKRHVAEAEARAASKERDAALAVEQVECMVQLCFWLMSFSFWLSFLLFVTLVVDRIYTR